MRSLRGIGSCAFRVSFAAALAMAVGVSVTACGDDGDDAPGGGGSGGGAGKPQKLVILHTNDLHSHLEGFGPEQDYTPLSPDDDETIGGIARLASVIDDARDRAEDDDTPVLLLDAGDFMMGTLFEFLATTRSPELSLMQTLGYDATTLGNHEFDWTPTGLAGILQASAENGVTVPIVASNLRFDAGDDGDDALEAVASAGLIRSKLVKDVGGIKVGIFGLLGADAAQVTPMAAPVTFEAIADAAEGMVRELREDDGVDLVIALSHSGIDSDGNGEDRVLAEAVSGIDIIVSGHTHDSLSEPVEAGGAVIVTAGSYGRYLGELAVTVTPSATAGEKPDVSVDDYALREIDDSIEGDEAIESTIDDYRDDLDMILSAAGLASSAVVATTGTDLDLPEYAEAPIGNLVTDAYRAASAAAEPDDPAVIGVDANGQIRAALQEGETGEVWLADLFRVVPLGIGPNQQPGFPLVTFYLNALDIRSGLELGAAREVLPNDYFLQVSGLKVEHDMSKPPFGRVARVALVTDDGEEELDFEDTDTCYKVVTTSYVAGLLGVVESATSGLLAVNAKDDDCETLVNPTTRYIDRDPDEDGLQEIKQWQALLGYVSALPDTDDDDIPNIPEAYGAPQGRIVEQ